MFTIRTKRGLTAVASIALVGLALTACSSGDGESTESAGEFTSDETISLRVVTAEGSGFSNYPDAQVGARAAVAAINADGGVNGKKIEFSFCNTRADANQSLTCAREAVADEVDALVGDVDIYNTQSMPVLSQGGIPVIGNVATNDADAVSTDVSYPIHGGNYGNAAAGPALCKEAGYGSFGVIALDFAGSLSQAELMKAVAADLDLDVADTIVVPGTGVTDYSPYAQQLKEAGTECAYVLLGPAALTGFYKGVAGIGLDVQLAATVFSFGESEAQATGTDATDGIWATSPVPSPNDEDSEAVAAWAEGLEAAGVSENDVVLRRSAGINAFLSVYAAAGVAEQIDGEVTPASMLEMLKTTEPIDVQGALTWDPASLGSSDLGAFPRLPDAPVFALEFQDGKLVPTDLEPIEAPLAPAR